MGTGSCSGLKVVLKAWALLPSRAGLIPLGGPLTGQESIAEAVSCQFLGLGLKRMVVSMPSLMEVGLWAL